MGQTQEVTLPQSRTETAGTLLSASSDLLKHANTQKSLHSPNSEPLAFYIEEGINQEYDNTRNRRTGARQALFSNTMSPTHHIKKAGTKKNARLLIWRFSKYGVDEGDRTLDNGSHNPVLYQLSYAHHIAFTALFASLRMRIKAQLRKRIKPL